MIKNIEIFSVVAISLLLASSAQAKVTPVHEYNQSSMKTSADEMDISCQTYGYFDTIQANAVCSKKKLINGTDCYDCHCGNEYQYSCTSAGITGPDGNACTADGTTKYSYCECATNYISETRVTKDLDSIHYPTPAEEGGAVCYKSSEFDCADGYKEFSANPTADGVTYTTETPYTGSTLKCVSGYDATSKYMETIPSSGYDCMSYSSVYLSSLKDPISLYYFTGCSDSGNCSSSMQDCISYNSQYHSGSGIRCYKAIGCQKGTSSDGSFCSPDASSASSFLNYTSVSEGSYTCSKVSGCKSDFEEIYANLLYKGNASDFASNTSTIYDVRSFNFASGNIICRTPSGCSTTNGYYDTSSCWNGMLSWFIPKEDGTCSFGMYYDIYTGQCTSKETGYVFLKKYLGPNIIGQGTKVKSISVIPASEGHVMPVKNYNNFSDAVTSVLANAETYCQKTHTGKYEPISSEDIINNKAFGNIYKDVKATYGYACIATTDKILYFAYGEYKGEIKNGSYLTNICELNIRYHCKRSINPTIGDSYQGTPVVVVPGDPTIIN